VAGATIAAGILALSFTVFFAARAWLGLTLAQLQTLMFLMLVFSGQGTVYLVRERRHFWRSVPSRWLLLTSFVDIVAVSVLATRGILMAAVPPAFVAGLLLLVLAYLVLLDFMKIRVFGRLGVK
jgi:H+-transporting ATPase